MAQYKVIKNSPVFAYVNGELMHDFPKRIIRRGETVEGNTQMLLITDPEKGSANLPFLAMNDDKFIKLKNLKPMLNYSKSGNKSNFSNAQGASGSHKKPCNCNAAQIYFGLCADPNCVGVKSFKPEQKKPVVNEFYATGAADVDKPISTPVRYVVGGGIGLAIGAAISHFTGGKNMPAFLIGGVVVGLGAAWYSGNMEAKEVAARAAAAKEAAAKTVTPPTPTSTAASALSDNISDNASNAAGVMSEDFAASGAGVMSNDFAVVGNMMKHDANLRKKPCIFPECTKSRIQQA